MQIDVQIAQNDVQSHLQCAQAHLQHVEIDVQYDVQSHVQSVQGKYTKCGLMYKLPRMIYRAIYNMPSPFTTFGD